METFSALLTLCEGNHQSLVDTPHKGQWRGALMLSLINAWTNSWANNRGAGDLRRHRTHYDVTNAFPESELNHYLDQWWEFADVSRTWMISCISHYSVRYRIWSLLIKTGAYWCNGKLFVIPHTLTFRQQKWTWICCLQNGSNFDQSIGNLTLCSTAFSCCRPRQY